MPRIPIRIVSTLSLLVLSGSGFAQQGPTPPVAVPGAALAPASESSANSAELEAFQGTLERYEERMQAFSGEAEDIVQAAEQAERDRIDRMFGGRLMELDAQQDELRAQAIGRFEAFLQKYPVGPHTAHAMFRLGDLYYEKTEADYFLESAEYEKTMAGIDFDTATEIPEAPQKDYSRSVALYRRIIEQHEDYRFIDGAYYMLGFCLARDGSRQFDEDASRDVFQALVDKYPNSDFAAAAHLRLGEYYFDRGRPADKASGRPADVEVATAYYQKVVDLSGVDGALYDEGLYKLAWSHYKLSNYDQALMLFTKLLDWSKSSYEETGIESPTAPEAIEYTAISFSDISDVTGASPLESAQAFYARVGERSFEKDVYVRLATVLTDQARFQDAIEVYDFLQERWPEDGENPTHQWRVAQIYYWLEDQASAQAAIQELTERYNDEGAWWAANRANPEAQSIARAYIEKSLAAVATGYHNEGIASGNLESFARAADLYGQYLRKFPFASDYYEIQWYRADTLFKTAQFDAAEQEYLQLLKTEGHPYMDGALWNLMQVRKKRLDERYPNLDERPADAVEARRITLESGHERVIYQLSADHQAFVDVVNQLLAADLKEPDFREALDNNRVPLKYLVAQIYYHHGMFDEVRPLLEDLVYNHSEWDEAAFAASMMINSYQEEENLQKVQLLAAEYAGLPLGGGKKVREFGDLAEGAAFKLAEQLIAKDRLLAAQAFERFMSDYPRSKYLADAHYNAANSYELSGRLDDANRLFKQYIDNIEAGVYKQDERSRALYFRIASNYADVLDLDRAIKYYEALYQRFPDYQDSSSALYNAAFLRIGLADHRGAAENFERYARLNPTPADAENVLFAAGDQWEQVGASEAISFYKRYLDRYPAANADHVMEAHYRIALLSESTGGGKGVDAAWRDLNAAYQRLAPSGGVGPRGRQYAAMAEIRDLQREYDSFAQIEFTKNEERNVQLLTETKVLELQRLDEHATRIITVYADFDASSASLYLLGRAYLDYSDMLYNAPPPRGLDEEGMAIYQEEIDRRRIPIEDKGRARLESNVQKAKTEKEWNDWVTKTLEVLAKRFPSDFVQEKQELRGTVESLVVPKAGPVAIDAAQTQPAGGAQ